MVKITLSKSEHGMLLSKLLQAQKIDFALPCSGNHVCGKCRVIAQKGLEPISPEESKFLSKDEIMRGVRLACFAKVCGDAEIEIPENEAASILDDCVQVFENFLPMMSIGCYGLAIDIGTTTVVCSLYGGDSLANSVGTVSEMNLQRRFGADVISRINYSTQNSLLEVQETIRLQLDKMVSEICIENAVERGRITSAVVTGNTTMMHYFAGMNPAGIGAAPFIPESLFNIYISNALKGIKVYIPPCVSAYVGADLVCCVLASGMAEKDRVSFIVDIGTNGEMALLSGGVLYSCSTAAGPAFEGVGISCGMFAQRGAVCSVEYKSAADAFVINTIGDTDARGVCGSGLIDAVSSLLESGVIDESGRMLKTGHKHVDCIREDENGLRFEFPGASIYISQNDIRQLQLAKGAILAGIETLLSHAGVTINDVCDFYICGGFGTFLNVASAERIGLVPESTSKKAIVLGNGALCGAAMTLVNRNNIDKLVRIKKMSNYIELSADSMFMEKYISSMTFKRECSYGDFNA